MIETGDFGVPLEIVRQNYLTQFYEQAMALNAMRIAVNNNVAMNLVIADVSAFVPSLMTLDQILPSLTTAFAGVDDDVYPWVLPADHPGENGVGRRALPSGGAGEVLWRPIIRLSDVRDNDMNTSVQHTYRDFVLADGVLATGALVGTISSSGEESAAKIANFTVRMPKGPLNPLDYFMRKVQIEYAVHDDAGTTLASKMAFQGFVDVPQYDPTTRLMTFNCSDERQKLIKNMERDQITALTPDAKYSTLIFDEDDESLAYLDDRMSTVPYALDIDNQENWQWTPWKAKTTADYRFTEANIIDESLQVQMARGSDIVNYVEVDLGYNFPRIRTRRVRFHWGFPGGVCDWMGLSTKTYHARVRAGYTLPTKDLILQAADSTGWCLESAYFTELPSSGRITCDQPVGATVETNVANLINTQAVGTHVMKVSGVLRKVFVQDVDETYDLVVKSSSSVTVYGKQKSTQAGSLSADADIEEFESDLCCNPTISTSASPAFVSYPSVPGDSFYNTYFDADDTRFIGDGSTRDGLQEIFEIIACQARNQILETHRLNTVTFQTPMNPNIERHHTLHIDTHIVTCVGKVQSYSHVMNIETGEAVTEIVLAISKRGGEDTTDSPFTMPEKPDTITATATTGANKIILDTHYGGISLRDSQDDATNLSIGDPIFGGVGSNTHTLNRVSGTDPETLNECDGTGFDEIWDGYVGNREPADIDSITYNERFTIKLDEFEDLDREPIEGTKSDAPEYDVTIPDDQLDIIVPDVDPYL